MSDFLTALQAYPRKRVPLEDLRHRYFALYPDVQNSPERGAMLLAELQSLAAQGVLILPAADSWEKIGVPPLPKWVTLIRERAPQDLPDLANVVWAPELGFWTELRPAQLAALLPINEFLLRRRGAFMRVPIKERSLEIYGDEKRLDAMCTGDTLFSGKLPLERIGCFRVPQPLPYRVADAPGHPVLVVENHNTYWSFGEWNHTVRRYAAVIYGGGQNFRLTGRALDQAMRETQAVGAEYFGDLDPKGVSIPLDFNRTVEPGFTEVTPAISLYRWLLTNGVRREKSECRSFAAGLAPQWLDAAMAVELESLWSAGLWLPQEALGIEQLQSF
ncbi:Wadjet anti-phage system protein JetD domain-containing protein [Aquabacterium sp.]|uniref:Wadjet anti-phage system protein JetD domain-containing protein n=1 Tax=Aquabacterium sp. TaxID=1872578 RepID=UPI0040377CE4